MKFLFYVVGSVVVFVIATTTTILKTTSVDATTVPYDEIEFISATTAASGSSRGYGIDANEQLQQHQLKNDMVRFSNPLTFCSHFRHFRLTLMSFFFVYLPKNTRKQQNKK